MTEVKQKMPWLKWWRGGATDQKLRLVAHRCGCDELSVVGAWVLILEQCDDDGMIVTGFEDDSERAVKDLLMALGNVLEGKAELIAHHLQAFGLISFQEGAGWRVVRWRDRQRVDSTSRERTRKWRAKKEKAYE